MNNLFLKNKYIISLVIFLLFHSGIITAQNQPIFKKWDKDYKAVINKNKLIVRFSENVDLDTQKEALQVERHLQQVEQHIYLPQPQNTVIVRLQKVNDTQYQQAIENLQKDPHIEAVEPYLRLENGAEMGILPKIFVHLKEKNDLEKLQEILHNLTDIQLEKHPYLSQVYNISTHKNTPFSTLDIATSLHQSGLFDYAEPNYLLNPIVASTNDPLLERQWQVQNVGSVLQGSGTPQADMSVLDAWWYTTGDPNIKVAVIDSGTDTNHVDLKNNLLAGYDAIGNETDGYPYLTYPSESHGTACAGIIGAEGNNEIGIAGIAYDCSIIPVKVFYYVDTLNLADLVPFSTSEWMTNAISWAWQEAEADVLSNSWGLPPLLLALLPGEPAVVEQAIEEAAKNGRAGKGVPMLFSSGNDGNLPIWPSHFPSTISVNASSQCDERKSPSSCDGGDWEGNWGDNLDITAPGVLIPSCDLSKAFGYSNTDFTNTFGGTSAACPNAAGVVALILSTNPDFSYAQVKELLLSTADKVGGYDYDSVGIYGAWSPEMGYGRVNAFNAVIQAKLTTTTTELDAVRKSLHISPNPATNKLVVDYVMKRQCDVTLRIFNVIGMQVFEKKSDQGMGSNRFQIPLKQLNLSNGTYFLQLVMENEKISEKFIVF